MYIITQSKFFSPFWLAPVPWLILNNQRVLTTKLFASSIPLIQWYKLWYSILQPRSSHSRRPSCLLLGEVHKEMPFTQLSEDKIAKFLTNWTEEMQEYAFTFAWWMLSILLSTLWGVKICNDKYPLITIQRNRPMFLKKFYQKESLLRT